jgi:hypothetical protein
MAEATRQFQGTKNDNGSFSVTPVEPVDLSKRNMVKFDKANPVHKELIRSLGDSAPHSPNTMKGENVMLHAGGYFSTAKDEAPAKTEGKEKPTKAVAEKRTYTKKTTKKAAAPATRPTKAAAPASAPKKGGALAAARAAEDAARKRGDLKR